MVWITWVAIEQFLSKQEKKKNIGAAMTKQMAYEIYITFLR